MEQGRAKEGGLAPRSRGVCDLGPKPPWDCLTYWPECLESLDLLDASNQSSRGLVEAPGFLAHRTWVLATNLLCDHGQATCPLSLSFPIWNGGLVVSGCWWPLVAS